MPDGAVPIERDVGRPAADVDDEDAELLLVLVQDRLAGRERLEHDVVDGQAGPIHRAHHVMHGRHRAGDDVHLDLEPDARHADRLADPVAVVHDEILRQDVDDLAILRQADRARGLDRALDVRLAHLAVLAGDGHDAAAVDAADMAAGDAGVDARDLDARHLLGLADGGPDRLHGRVDVDHDAAAEAARGRAADADDVEAGRPDRLADDGADLRGADVEADDEVRRLGASHQAPPRRRTTWSRNRRSTVRMSSVTAWASTPSRRASRSSQSSVPRRTSTPSAV